MLQISPSRLYLPFRWSVCLLTSTLRKMLMALLLLQYLMLQRLTRLAESLTFFSSRKSKQKGKVQKCKANKHSTHQHDRIQSISENSDEPSSHISEHICYSTVRLQSISENSDEHSSHISEHICYSTEAQKAC